MKFLVHSCDISIKNVTFTYFISLGEMKAKFMQTPACSWTDIHPHISSDASFQENGFDLTKEQERWVVGIMLSVTLVKLLLMVYCRSFTNEIVKAYAQDHFFDVVTNIIGLIAALLANYMEEWMDPVGAIIVSTNHLPPSLSLLAIIFLRYCTRINWAENCMFFISNRRSSLLLIWNYH